MYVNTPCCEGAKVVASSGKERKKIDLINYLTRVEFFHVGITRNYSDTRNSGVKECIVASREMSYVISQKLWKQYTKLCCPVDPIAHIHSQGIRKTLQTGGTLRAVSCLQVRKKRVSKYALEE